MCRDGLGAQTGGMKRPYRSMISARYRQREERRRMLKISAGKLSRIDDPEASLCRSVLINNTLRRLKREPTPTAVSDADVTPIVSMETTSAEMPQPDFAHDVPVDEQDDCCDDAFSVPPTPRLLTSIDDDDAASAKRPHQEFASCGQASMIDGGVFHSLMASLETT